MYYSFKEKGRNFGKSGSFAVVSVKKLRNKGRIKVKKEICIAMILKTRKNTFRKSGIGIKVFREFLYPINSTI